ENLAIKPPILPTTKTIDEIPNESPTETPTETGDKAKVPKSTKRCIELVWPDGAIYTKLPDQKRGRWIAALFDLASTSNPTSMEAPVPNMPSMVAPETVKVPSPQTQGTTPTTQDSCSAWFINEILVALRKKARNEMINGVKFS
ncbi:hypothetical protein IFM89_023038, partial [Coptis chinensis]